MVLMEDLRKARMIAAEAALNNRLIQPVFDRLDREYKLRLAGGESEMEKLVRRARDIRQLI